MQLRDYAEGRQVVDGRLLPGKGKAQRRNPPGLDKARITYRVSWNPVSYTKKQMVYLLDGITKLNPSYDCPITER